MTSRKKLLTNQRAASLYMFIAGINFTVCLTKITDGEYYWAMVVAVVCVYCIGMACYWANIDD